jgi:23S rRNA pseudouridine2605 synthase
MARRHPSRREDDHKSKPPRRGPSHTGPGTGLGPGSRRRSESDRPQARRKGPGPKPRAEVGGPQQQRPVAGPKPPGAGERRPRSRPGASPVPSSKPERKNQSTFEPGSGKPERLQKVLAHAGLGSRRVCEEYMLQGRVTVDGKVVRELGTRVDPDQADIAVDGERVRLEKMVYFAVNKPKGYVSTNDDPAGRPRVIDILPEVPERVYSVGRLDEDSTGLMILTNDGELANRLAHPRYGVEKVYRALVAGSPSREIVSKLTEGIWLSDGKVRAKRARVVGTQGEATTIELVLAEGKKREIRRMLAKLGHKVMSLNRIAIGPVILKGLSPGESRPLSRTEIDLLRKVAAGIEVSPPRFRQQKGDRRESHGRDRDRSHAKPGRPPRGTKAGQVPVERDHHSDPEPRSNRPGSLPPPGKPVSKPGAAPVAHGQEPSSKPSPLPGRKPAPASAPGRKPAESSPAPAPAPAPAPRSAARKPLPAEPRPIRKIIGLDPKLAAESGASMAGRPARKRPVVKKRPPRKASGIKRFREDGDER